MELQTLITSSINHHMAGNLKLLPVLLLALFTFSVYATTDVFWSINCGATDFYIDDNSISWTPDDTLVSNGVARVVQSSNSISPVLDSLRVFTSRKKNCYSTAVTKGDKVLVRASFNYGNYDRLSTPPVFDLHFDGNFWTTVKTTITGLQMYEATYVAKGDAVSVCVAQTKPNHFPFISAVEFRSVESEVYKQADESRALFLLHRVSFGASETLRFPNDPYDRIWVPQPALGGTRAVTSDAILIDGTTTDNPPTEILGNAITVDNKTESLILGTISPSNTPVYMNMYFSEVRDSTQNRSFMVYESSSSDTRPLSSLISPPYGGVDERNFDNYTVASITNISLVATDYSDLPPLINAFEIFNVSGVLTDGTDNNDVVALTSLQNTFDMLAQWSGDPCLPAPYSWDWLNCSNDATPRITSLHLDSFDLSGSLPDISSMDALEIIDLHNNSLTGPIPSFLGTMTNLKQLNLADNQFSGPIPTSLSKNNKLKLTVTGNPSLCTSGKSCSSSPGTIDSGLGSTTTAASKKKSSKLPVVLGTTIPTFFLIWVVVGVLVILRRKRRSTNVNMSTVAGHMSGGANGKPNALQRVGEEIANKVAENAVQQTFGSPSPLLDTSDQTSDLYESTTHNS